MVQNKKTPKVLVVMGSDSDLPVLENCIKLLKDFGVEVDAHVCSAHRTPDRARELAVGAEGNGVEVIIAAAGKAAHLPGVLAAFTTLPVIGIPIKASTLDGLDALLSIVQMPAGIPVATVAIDGAENAALLAVQIMSGAHPELAAQMKSFRQKQTAKVFEKDNILQDKIKGKLQ